MSDFVVNDYDDYHDILYRTEYKHRIELGCFPVEKYGYSRYFGLFYNDNMPSVEEVIKVVCDMAYVGGKFLHVRTGRNIAKSFVEVKNAVKKAMSDYGL